MIRTKTVAWKVRSLEVRIYVPDFSVDEFPQLLVEANAALSTAGIVPQTDRDVTVTSNQNGVFFQYRMSFTPDQVDKIDPLKQETLDRLKRAGFKQSKER